MKLEAKRAKKRENANRKYAELKEAAETDLEAAEKLAKKRRKGVEATNHCNDKLRQKAEEGCPTAIRKLETHQEYNRDYLREYHLKKKEEAEREAS